MNTVFFLLPKFHGVMKTLCLEVVLCRSDEVTDLYLKLKSKDFIQIMKHRWVGRQLHLTFSRLIKCRLVQLSPSTRRTCGFSWNMDLLNLNLRKKIVESGPSASFHLAPWRGHVCGVVWGSFQVWNAWFWVLYLLCQVRGFHFSVKIVHFQNYNHLVNVKKNAVDHLQYFYFSALFQSCLCIYFHIMINV